MPGETGTRAAAWQGRCEELGCVGITVSWWHGGVSHTGVACRRLQSYRDNERKVAARRRRRIGLQLFKAVAGKDNIKNPNEDTPETLARSPSMAALRPIKDQFM